MESNIQNVESSTKGVDNEVLFFILGFGLAVIIALVLYLVFIAGQIENLTEDNNMKDALAASLNHEIEEKTSSLEKLSLMLRDAKEKTVVLEREMTTFNDYENTDNLINRNSLFKTIENIELRNEPGNESYVEYEVDSGFTGEVIGGPRLVEDEVWWNVSFPDKEEGWVSEGLLERVPSIVIKIDFDKDGESDAKIRWEGDYDLDGIVVVPGTDGTYIRYKGEAMPDPYKVIELNDRQSSVEMKGDLTYVRKSGYTNDSINRFGVTLLYSTDPQCNSLATEDTFMIEFGDGYSVPADCKGAADHVYDEYGSYISKYFRNDILLAEVKVELN